MPRHMPDKAYENLRFVNSREGRVMRIMAEYLEPQKRLRDAGIEDTIVFFGSARIPSQEDATRTLSDLRGMAKVAPEALAKAQRNLEMSRYYEAARSLSHKLTKWAAALSAAQGDPGQRFSVVTGGGPGIMEAANRGAAEAGGSTLGMNISLPFEQYPNDYISDGMAFEFHYFFVRKFWFFYLAKALVVFPGGFGTLDELFELLTLVQTEKTKKYMPIIVYGRQYWDELIDFDAMVRWNTIAPEDMKLFRFFDDVDSAFEYLRDQLTHIYLRSAKAKQ